MTNKTKDQAFPSEAPRTFWQRIFLGPDQQSTTSPEEAFFKELENDAAFAREKERLRLRRQRIQSLAEQMMVNDPGPTNMGFVGTTNQIAALAVKKSIKVIDAIDLAMKAEFDQDPPQ